MIKLIRLMIIVGILLLARTYSTEAGVFNNFTDWKDTIDKLEPRTGTFIDFKDTEVGTLSAISLYTLSTDSGGKVLKIGSIDAGYIYPDKGFVGLGINSEFLEKFNIDLKIPVLGKVQAEAWAGATYDFEIKAAGGGVGISIIKHFGK